MVLYPQNGDHIVITYSVMLLHPVCNVRWHEQTCIHTFTLLWFNGAPVTSLACESRPLHQYTENVAHDCNRTKLFYDYHFLCNCTSSIKELWVGKGCPKNRWRLLKQVSYRLDAEDRNFIIRQLFTGVYWSLITYFWTN